LFTSCVPDTSVNTILQQQNCCLLVSTIWSTMQTWISLSIYAVDVWGMIFFQLHKRNVNLKFSSNVISVTKLIIKFLFEGSWWWCVTLTRDISSLGRGGQFHHLDFFSQPTTFSKLVPSPSSATNWETILLRQPWSPDDSRDPMTNKLSLLGPVEEQPLSSQSANGNRINSKGTLVRRKTNLNRKGPPYTHKHFTLIIIPSWFLKHSATIVIAY
jgi:hypothetical protein